MKNDLIIISGKTLPEWHSEWTPIQGGLRRSHPELRHLVGVFRALLNGTPMFLGCGREYLNRGLMKRLSDFTRSGDGGRDHHGGLYIHEYRRQVEIEVIVTGIDEAASWLALRLKEAFLSEDRPPWNVPLGKPPVLDSTR